MPSPFPYPGIIDGLIYDAVGGSSPQTIPQGSLVDPTGGWNPDSITTAAGDVNVKDRHAFTVRVSDFSHFAALNAFAIARTQMRVTVVHDGADNDQWEPMNISVVPVFPIADMCRAWIANAGTIDTLASSDPTTEPGEWTDLGRFINTPSFAFNISEGADGCGDPVYHSMNVVFESRLFNDPAVDVDTTLTPFNRSIADVAIEHSNGTYLRFKNFALDKGYVPEYGEGNFLGFAMNIKKRVNDPTISVIFPATTPDFLYSFDLQFAGSGITEADYLTKV